MKAVAVAPETETQEEKDGADLCEKAMRKIIGKYLEHQTL